MRKEIKDVFDRDNSELKVGFKFDAGKDDGTTFKILMRETKGTKRSILIGIKEVRTMCCCVFENGADKRSKTSFKDALINDSKGQVLVAFEEITNASDLHKGNDKGKEFIVLSKLDHEIFGLQTVRVWEQSPDLCKQFGRF